MKAYAAYNKDLSIRLHSSSGGIFYSLAKYILDNNGIVFGAAWTKDWLVDMIYVDSIENLEKLLKSKYIRANDQNTFAECKYFLDQGRQVLYSGLPCQITALKRYLNKDYNNLFTVSVACHGLMPLQRWKDYLETIKKPGCDIIDINFRNKISNWKNFKISITYSDTTKLIESKKDNKYFSDFLSSNYFNKSCYNCKFKFEENLSDIQLGDYWHIEEIHPEMSDNKGTSFILCYTSKGEQLLNYCSADFELKPTELDFIKKHNAGIKRAVKYRKKVAIITLPLTMNYGNNLQAYALFTYIKNLGYDCTLLNINIGNKKIRTFMTKNINIINFSSAEDLISTIHEFDYDIFIVGSDIIWTKRKTDFDKYYLEIPFLRFTKDWGANRIAFSASIGKQFADWPYSSTELSIIKDALKNFNAISSRELSTANEISNYFSINAMQTLDPTMLLPKEHYLDICKNIPVRNEDVFCYLLNHFPDKVALQKEQINAFCVNNNLTMFDQDKLNLQEWLAAFRDAKYIITNSFHGAVFSIIFSKQFILIDDSSKWPQRFLTLESIFELQNNIVRYPYNFNINNFSAIYTNLALYADFSRKFLATALKLSPTKWAVNTLKPTVALCCIVKNENNYIIEWIEHYKKLGFNHIFVYDNNDFDGEDLYSKIKDYIDSGYITYIDVREKIAYQSPAYLDCYTRYANEYDWIAYFDCDEFLDIETASIQEFLAQDKFKDFKAIAICWQNFDDSDLIEVENNNYSVTRFVSFIDKQRDQCKRILRTGLQGITHISAHGTVQFGKTYTVATCNALGNVTQNKHRIQNWTWDCAKLKHYRYKTIAEFINFKLNRGYATEMLNNGKDITVDRFFMYNKKTPAKLACLQNYNMREFTNE